MSRDTRPLFDFHESLDTLLLPRWHLETPVDLAVGKRPKAFWALSSSLRSSGNLSTFLPLPTRAHTHLVVNLGQSCNKQLQHAGGSLKFT